MSKAVTELIFFKFFCNWSGTEQLYSFYKSVGLYSGFMYREYLRNCEFIK